MEMGLHGFLASFFGGGFFFLIVKSCGVRYEGMLRTHSPVSRHGNVAVTNQNTCDNFLRRQDGL